MKSLGVSLVKAIPFIIALGCAKFFISSSLFVVLAAILIGVLHLVYFRSDYSLKIGI